MAKVALDQTLQETNQILRFIANAFSTQELDSWESIANAIRHGLGKQYFNVGDELVCNWHDGKQQYELSWVVADFRSVTLQNGTTSPAMILMAKNYVSGLITYDGVEYHLPEPDNMNNSSIKRGGYARWRYSAARQWLNSAQPQGLWWKPNVSTEVAPSQLNSIPGFMNGLDSDFLNIIKPIKVKTLAISEDGEIVEDFTYDKFWIPSIEQVNGIPNSLQKGEQGKTFAYFKQIMSNIGIQSNSSHIGRRFTYKDGYIHPSSIILRSVNTNEPDYPSYVIELNTQTGAIIKSINTAELKFGLLPICAIC